jgi:hypothetical membrane protein
LWFTHGRSLPKPAFETAPPATAGPTIRSVTRFPATVGKQVVFGAACWTLSVAFFVSQPIVQAATTRPYSISGNLISDLGITACGPFANGGYHVDVCSPLHSVMNVTFVAVGLLQAVGAIATLRAWPMPRAAPGLILLVLAGAALAIAGLAPENVNLSLHTTAAGFGIDFLNAAVIVLGVALLGPAPVLGVITLLVGIFGVVGTIIFRASLAGIPIGTAERLAVYPSVAMVVVLGVYLLSMGRRPQRT